MFNKILIANRGEIALRILRACRTLGVGAVVAYSEADRDSLAVQLADEAICIGPADAKRSYLSAPAVISAAIVTGCDAIHPGYGFLSEDDGFADVVRAHGLTFIGPSAEVLERFASKEATRRLLGGYGLPTIPGSGMLRDDAHALEEAERIGYPVLIKPSAGGGGKGMRMVRSPRELEAAFKVCRSEARAAFGDDALYLEKWLEDNRHVEVQVAVDRFGHGVHLGERDCSVQRRHQKIIEEAPTPGPRARPPARTWPSGRSEAVVAAGYENVGTLEFLVDAQGNAYFIEINCRIQVEHPVTEMLHRASTSWPRRSGSPPASRSASARPTSYPRATPSSSGSLPRTRRTTSGRRPGTVERYLAPGGPGVRMDCTCIPATRSRRTTTRCSASSSSGRRTGRRRSPAADAALRELVVDGVTTNIDFTARSWPTRSSSRAR